MNKYLSGTYYSRHWRCIGEQDNLPALLGAHLLEEADRSPLGPNTHPSSWRDHWPRMHSWAPLEELPAQVQLQTVTGPSLCALIWGHPKPSQSSPWDWQWLLLPWNLNSSPSAQPCLSCPNLSQWPCCTQTSILDSFLGNLPQVCDRWIRRWQVWDDEVERLKMHVGGRAIGPAEGVNVKWEGKQGIEGAF